MKNLIYILSILLLSLACSSDDASESDFDPNDVDGDGVTNQQETVDNTDPNNACSYNPDSQYYPSVSNAWKSRDCDGDGVTNEKELDPDGNGEIEGNGTSPLSKCDLVVAHQTVTPREGWLIRDCDEDGVSNGQEITDNTDIFDNCSFIIQNQDLEPSSAWNYFDCDGDGRNNEQEIIDNTDLLDSNDFNGSGDILKEIKRFNYYGNGSDEVLASTSYYINNGTLFDKTVDVDGNISLDFEYDNENKLISLNRINNNNQEVVSFTYNNNNQISSINKVTIEDGSNTETTTNFEYVGTDTINVHDDLDRIQTIYTFLANGKISQIQSYIYASNRYIITNYNYSTSNDLTHYRFDYYIYNFNLNQYIPDPEADLYAIGHYYNYHEEVLNPKFESNSNVYLNMVLSGFYFSQADFSIKHQSRYSYAHDWINSGSNFLNFYYQSNGLPTQVTLANNYAEPYGKLYYYYE